MISKLQKQTRISSHVTCYVINPSAASTGRVISSYFYHN